MAELIEIHGAANNAPIGDVVFVHGLGGDPRTTWQHDDQGFTQFWPEWLGEELPNINVWTLGYEASASNWFGTSMSLVDRARGVLDYLDANDVGTRPIVFVVHSLGGLVAKQLLRLSKDAGPGHPSHSVFQNTRGIVFFATPHAGSHLAGYLDTLRLIARRSKAAADLKFNDVHLRDLDAWFRNVARPMGLRIKVYAETSKTNGVLVVDQVSSDPGIEGVYPVPFDADHVSICKLNDTGDPRFKQTLRLVKACFGGGDKPPETGALKGLEKVTLDIGVDGGLAKGERNGERYSDDVVLRYQAVRDKIDPAGEPTVAIVPVMRYLDELYSGGPVRQLDFFHNPFLCQFPNLDVTIVNNSAETIAVTGAVFDVERSTVDRSPVVVFNNRNVMMVLEIQNEGWGEIQGQRISNCLK